MSDVLFEVHEENLETGLRGYPVGYCKTSSVDAEKGLFYRGKPITDCTAMKPEEAISLLYGSDITKELLSRGSCQQDVIDHIEKLPQKGAPMKLFTAAIILLGMLEGKGDYREDALNLIAKIPHLGAAVINYHAGWGKTPESKPELGYMENFTQLLNAPNCDKKILHEVLTLFNILHYDHGGGNLSAFVGKAVASGLDDLYGSIASSMCALAGPRHGCANQVSLEFVQSVLDEAGTQATEKQIEELIRKRISEKKLIFGFGHAVLRVEDPRATIMYDYAEKHFPDHPLVRTSLLLRKAGPTVLKENPKIQNPYPNLDAISGSMLSGAGFPYPEYYTILFGIARSVGIAIQIVYERLEARDGKGTPIIRPKYLYKKE